MNILGYDVTKATTKTKAPQNAVGFVGLRGASGIVDEEFLRVLKWPDAGDVYHEMASNDAVAGGCIYLIETLARKATWHVKLPKVRPGEGQPAGTDMTEWKIFIEQCMNDMDVPWDTFISEALSMLTYGFSFHEVIYKVRRGPLEKDRKFKSNYSDGKIGWQSMPIRSQGTLKEWTFDTATGEAIEFVQDISEAAIVGVGGDVKIPLEGNLLFRTKAARGNPEGQSILRRAYRSWYFKKYIEELEGMGIERHLAGIPLLQPDENTPLFDTNNPDMVKLLEWSATLVDGLRQDRNHGVVLPFGWNLKLLGPEGSNVVNTDTVIHRHESRIAITMLADLLLLGGDRTGSFALADAKKALLVTSIEAILGSMCALINTVAIPRLLILNGVTDLSNAPFLTISGIEESTLKDVALILRAANVDVTKNPELFNFIMRITGAPELTDEEIVALQVADKVAGTDPNKKTVNENDVTKPDGTPADGPRKQDATDNSLK